MTNDPLLKSLAIDVLTPMLAHRHHYEGESIADRIVTIAQEHLITKYDNQHLLTAYYSSILRRYGIRIEEPVMQKDGIYSTDSKRHVYRGSMADKQMLITVMQCPNHDEHVIDRCPTTLEIKAWRELSKHASSSNDGKYIANMLACYQNEMDGFLVFQTDKTETLRDLLNKESFNLDISVIARDLVLPILKTSAFCHDKCVLLRDITTMSFLAKLGPNPSSEIRLELFDLHLALLDDKIHQKSSQPDNIYADGTYTGQQGNKLNSCNYSCSV